MEIVELEPTTLARVRCSNGLGATHNAVRRWAAAEGVELSDVVVEVYGDWVEDASQLRTDVYHLLRPTAAPDGAGAG